MKHTHGTMHHEGPAGSDSVRDPVCGMQVSPRSPHGMAYGGQTYRF